MTGDLITAALDQLAAPRERIDQLDWREADHYGGISSRLAEITGLVTAG
jgi:hypothetical protein